MSNGPVNSVRDRLFRTRNSLQSCNDSQFLAWEGCKPAEMTVSGGGHTLAMSTGILPA
jgi:hypothetical protein